ncbi:MAG: serine--tRNA ligase [Candidatus Kerfeldbacteria bacterium RIFCSPHIGHO2_12_FULL_48_17]|uniref:Serine--tRNA ligase n=1 Tax=Candidatus Kerfeldbacteria bacterium RIFCSPHIGHO2_12_FULL_48_17 TaxID=1798542 RepID=A0A1G2AXR4_9BACT|nr:MAG: serine--tRNA ligase [Candidatus Kerfeldbacteria bacterium RIFCSPHIGHO2_12_FULL_48_17]
MLDIRFVRENKALVQKAAKDKRIQVSVEEVLKLDEHRRELQQAMEGIRKMRKTAAREKDAKKGKELKQKLQALEKESALVLAKYEPLLQMLPNVPSADTPVGKDESENRVVRKVGEPREFDFIPLPHWELGKKLDIIDNERAAKTSGARFTFLKREAARMEFALVQFVFQTLTDEKILAKIIEDAHLSVLPTAFIPIVPPVFIKPDAFQKMARLEPKDERYYIPSDDAFLIGSAEHTLGAMHMDETFPEADLPLRYIGFSTAFRREAGSYGKDTKGILRVHQFDKLEMESFTIAEDSIDEQNFFVAIQEYFMRALELPYHVVMICTGDMSSPDARQIDIETWMPGQGKYRETHTSDLMTDYQARRLHIRVKRKQGGTQFVHMNDATAFAVGRTLIAILENYQQKDGGIAIPLVLQPFMGGLKKISVRS